LQEKQVLYEEVGWRSGKIGNSQSAKLD